MRSLFRIKYKQYPHSKELTNKSLRLSTLTHPIYGIMLGAILGFASAFIFPASVTLPMILILVGTVAGPLLLRAYRKKKLAQYDAEYEQLLKTQEM